MTKHILHNNNANVLKVLWSTQHRNDCLLIFVNNFQEKITQKKIFWNKLRNYNQNFNLILLTGFLFSFGILSAKFTLKSNKIIQPYISQMQRGIDISLWEKSSQELEWEKLPARISFSFFFLRNLLSTLRRGICFHIDTVFLRL